MTSENENVKWCPMGRVSVQQIENGRVTAMQAGAFNLRCTEEMGDGKSIFRQPASNPDAPTIAVDGILGGGDAVPSL